MKKELPLFQSIATLVGTIIGAGILGVPYVFARAGFWTGTLVLIVVTLAMIAMKFMFGEMTLRTYGLHQASGYVDKYLGSFWKKIVSTVLILTISGSLLAYFLGIGQVLAELLGGQPFWWGIAFYLLASFFLFRGIKLIKSTEFVLSIFIIFIVLVILILSLNHVTFDNLNGFDLNKLLIPYGVILFACSGIVAVPEVRQILLRRERLFKKSIFWGAFLPSIIYFIFAWVVVGITGSSTTEVATVGLDKVLGTKILIIGNLFAFFTIATSFLTLGLGLKQVYHYDLKIKHLYAWLLTICLPLFIYFLGMHDFIKIIGLAGALGYGVNGVIYIFAYNVARHKGEREPEYKLPKASVMPISILLSVIFIVGMVYTFLENF